MALPLFTSLHGVRHTAGISCGPHFPATGCSGADLYALDASGVTSGTPSVWKFVNSFSELNAGTTQFGMLARQLRHLFFIDIGPPGSPPLASATAVTVV